MGDLCSKSKQQGQQHYQSNTSVQPITNQTSPFNNQYNRGYSNEVYSSYHMDNNNIYNYNTNYTNNMQSSNKANNIIIKEDKKNNPEAVQSIITINNNLKNENNTLVNESTILKAKINELQKQIKDKDDLITQRNKELEQLKNDNIDKNDKVNLVNETTKLKAQITQLQKQIKDKDDLITQRNKELEQLKKNDNIANNEKVNLVSETTKLKAQITQLQKQIKDKDNLITQRNKELEQLKKNDNIANNEKVNLVKETTNLKAQITQLQSQVNNKDNIINQINNELEKYKIAVSAYEQEKISLKNKENENIINLNNIINQNKAIILKQETEIENYKKENKKIQNQIQENGRKISSFESEKNNLKNELEKLKTENSLLKLNKEPILVGLNNIGATCYMNATLQCLSNTTNLTEYFLKTFKYESNNKNRIMSNEYYNVVKNLWDRDNNNKSFSPNSFKEKLSQENPLFQGIQANDSKDLINFLLERFHLELNEPRKVQNNNMNQNYEITPNDQLNEDKMLKIFINEFKMKYNSIISNLFYGMFETKSQCQNCRNVKFNFQIYSFLEFPLEQVNNYCFNHGKRQNYNNNKNPDVDLYECFEYNSNLDLMAGDNQMYCNICNSTQNALYGTQIYSAPNYLIINLNRGRGAVYECKVNFPEKLNLLNFITFKDGNTYFELYAVICHLGPSSMSGHFVAYCKKKIDDHFKWYLFNDAIVSECKNQEEYRNGMPYILFYKAV